MLDLDLSPKVGELLEAMAKRILARIEHGELIMIVVEIDDHSRIYR